MTAICLLVGFLILSAIVCIVAFGIGRVLDYLQDAEDADREA